jgi:ADP-ribosylglycohydrolase
MTDNLIRAKGVVYGLAIGDALGRVTEFMSLQNIKLSYRQDGITDLPEPALFTDDTQMSVAIGEALVRNGEKDLEAIMEAVRDEFVKWYHSPENNRSPGGTCLTGVANIIYGSLNSSIP